MAGNDHANDVRRYGAKQTYPRKEDDISRFKTRRVVATEERDSFTLELTDATLIVNNEEGVAVTVYLPVLAQCERDQEFTVQMCDPTGIAGGSITVLPQAGELMNEAALWPLVISGANKVRRVQRCLSNAFDSWYSMCCDADEQL